MSEKEIKYNLSITSPIYTPKGKNFKLKDLYNISKVKELIKEIDENKDLSLEEKVFLKIAAYRHTVFNYEKIAEYYANSDSHLQELMENSALVIIDFDKAIEKGFVKLSGKIKEKYLETHGK